MSILQNILILTLQIQWNFITWMKGQIHSTLFRLLFCHLVFSEKGINGLKQLLKIESMDEIFRSEFFVEPDNQNKFIREQIKKYVDSSLSL